MEQVGKQFAAKRVISYEIIATLLIIVLLWLDEIMDIPYLLLGAEATAINWRESLFESTAIAMVGAVIIYFTHCLSFLGAAGAYRHGRGGDHLFYRQGVPAHDIPGGDFAGMCELQENQR